MQLKRINIRHVEEFKQHGYLVLDNFISKETAVAIHKEAINLKQKGTYLVAINDKYTVCYLMVTINTINYSCKNNIV